MKRSLTFLIVAAIVAVAGLWFLWTWGFCRFYVPINHIAVITAKEGSLLPPGQILAREGQKGVQENVLGEGRYFLNPYSYEHTIVPVTLIEPGKVGVIVSKVGNDLGQGDFLAGPGQKGIQRGVLGPGKYKINPVGYKVDILDAISIPIGYSAVVTSLSGRQAPEGAFAKPGEKGVMENILQPGLYYINPKQYKVDVIEVGLNQVSLLGKEGGAVITKTALRSSNGFLNNLENNVLQQQAANRADYISNESQSGMSLAPAQQDFALSRNAGSGTWANGSTRNSAAPAAKPQSEAKKEKTQTEATFVLNQHVSFPSRDGFDVALDMTVEFEFRPENVAGIYRDYGDMPAVVEKILMPQILSISRLKGSAYRALDFIVGEGREKFQNELTLSLQSNLGGKHITTHNALIRHVKVPEQILEPIQNSSIATEQDLTNKERQKTAAKLAELNTETQLIEQRSAEVIGETRKLKASIAANQAKQVAELGGETNVRVSEIAQKTASIRAERDVALGKANADASLMVEGEKAKGYALKIKAFGDPQAYNLAEFARALNPALKINVLHTGPGTLWTDLDKMGLSGAAGAKALEKR
ncbi:MAG: SPFH domain-containing protein [Chthoniobacterales bacterium]